MHTRTLRAGLLLLVACASAASAQDARLAAPPPTRAIAPAPPFVTRDSSLFQAAAFSKAVRWHRRLGTVALGSFGTALVIGAASGNLGKLMDETACCPDGGMRNSTWRTVDRTLVDIGIVSYLGAAGLAAYRASHRGSAATSHRRNVHRWLALAHGVVFATSAVTGAIMGGAQESDPARFARVARIHVAANVAFVPLLAAAFTTMTVR